MRIFPLNFRVVTRRRRRGVVAALVCAGAFIMGCGGGGRDDISLVEETACPVYEDSAAALPHLLYADGSRTLNDRCMVRSVKLNPKIRAIYVNGHPIGFC
jgi:hypothetical protein